MGGPGDLGGGVEWGGEFVWWRGEEGGGGEGSAGAESGKVNFAGGFPGFGRRTYFRLRGVESIGEVCPHVENIRKETQVLHMCRMALIFAC